MFDALLQLIAISLALLCPGAIIILCLKKLDAISAVTLSILSTIAFWSSLVWLLRYIPISLLSIFYIVVLVTMLSLFYYRKQIDIKIESYYLLAAALAILILRLVPLSVNIAASGADMSMHTYITRLIVESGTLPKNYSPILDIPTFTSFPIGFHTISAIISLFTGIPSYRSAFIISCLSYALLSLSLYLFLKRHVSKEAAMSSSLIFSFLTWNPQGFAAWGGSPTILAFALAIVFISFHQAQENLFLTGLFLCSVLLTHPIIFVCLFYLYGVSSLMLKRWRYDAKVVAVAVLLCLPYLVSMENLATPSAVAWARGWVTNTQGNTGFAADIFSVWYLAPRYMFWIIFGRGIENLILLFCIPGYLFLSKKNKESWRYVAMIVGVFFLLLNVNYFILPLSYAIYPERLALFLLLPLSLFFSHFVEALPGKKYFLLLAILLAIFYNPSHFVAIQKGIVTSSDMAVFNYIDKNMPEEAVIENNYGDAGIYIPGILLRKVTVPHINLIYLDKQPSQKSDYIFIGSNCVYSCRLSAEEIGKNHRLVFRDRDSYLFRA